jgi:hypothetical protein
VVELNAGEEDEHLEVVLVLRSDVLGDEQEVVEEEDLSHLALVASHDARAVDEEQRTRALEHSGRDHQVLDACDVRHRNSLAHVHSHAQAYAQRGGGERVGDRRTGICGWMSSYRRRMA